jgi:hypothetical protein
VDQHEDGDAAAAGRDGAAVQLLTLFCGVQSEDSGQLKHPLMADGRR